MSRITRSKWRFTRIADGVVYCSYRPWIMLDCCRRSFFSDAFCEWLNNEERASKAINQAQHWTRRLGDSISRLEFTHSSANKRRKLGRCSRKYVETTRDYLSAGRKFRFASSVYAAKRARKLLLRISTASKGLDFRSAANPIEFEPV